MDKRNYNPLNEGYTGSRVSVNDGYSGSNKKSQAPARISSLKSAVIKPSLSGKRDTSITQNRK